MTTKNRWQVMRLELDSIRQNSLQYKNLNIDEICCRLQDGSLVFQGEKVCVVDYEDKIIGKVDRSIAEASGLIHRTANAFVFTPDNKVILLRRGVPDKAFYLCLSIVGGHLGLEEDYERGCKKEISEELNLVSNITQPLLNLGQELYDQHQDQNKEFRKLFKCTLTPKQYREFRKYADDLEKNKKSKTRNEYAVWLADERARTEGAGEVWSYCELELSQILNADIAQPDCPELARYFVDGLHYIPFTDDFNGETITGRAFFTPDILERIVRSGDALYNLLDEINGR